MTTSCLAIALLFHHPAIIVDSFQFIIRPSSSSLAHLYASSVSLSSTNTPSPPETDAQILDRILNEIDTGYRTFDTTDTQLLPAYGDPEDDALLTEEDDDPTAIDASTLGQWDASDFEAKFDYEWDPNAGETDPNIRDPRYTYVSTIEVDNDG